MLFITVMYVINAYILYSGATYFYAKHFITSSKFFAFLYLYVQLNFVF